MIYHHVPAALAAAALTACAPADAPSADTTTVTVNSPQALQPSLSTPAAPAPTPAAPNPTEAPAFEAGFYFLDLGDEQLLRCDFVESPGIVADCSPEFPVTWKLLDGDHEQARRVSLSVAEDGAASVEAHQDAKPLTEQARTTIDADSTATIAGTAVTLTENEALIDPGGGQALLLTPDSWELVDSN